MALSQQTIPIPRGSGLSSLVLARAGRLLLGINRDGAGFQLNAIDLSDEKGAGTTRWTASFDACPLLCLHERAGFIATWAADRYSFWDLDTGLPWATSMNGAPAHAVLPDARLLTLKDVGGVTRVSILDVAHNRVEASFDLGGLSAHVAVDDHGTHLLAWTTVTGADGAPAGRRSVLWDIATRAPLLALDQHLSNGSMMFQSGRSDVLVNPYHYGLGGPVVVTLTIVDGCVPRLDTAVIVDDDKERAPYECSVLSADGRFLATTYADQRDNHWLVGCATCVWDLQTRQRVEHNGVRPNVLAFDSAGDVVGVTDEWQARVRYRIGRHW